MIGVTEFFVSLLNYMIKQRIVLIFGLFLLLWFYFNTFLLPETYLNNKQVFTKGKPLILKKYDILVAILSIRNQQDKRESIRKQGFISNLAKWKMEHNVVVKFIIGKSSALNNTMEIEAEKKRFGDIIEVDVEERYENLTPKMAKLFEWAHYQTEFQFKVLIKVDDDMWVDLDKAHPLLMEQVSLYPNSLDHAKTMPRSIKPFPLTNNKNPKRDDTGKRGFGAIIGFIHFDQVKVIRENSKWADKQYPLDVYPFYPDGPVYAVTRSLVEYLGVAESQGLLKHFSNEDATIGTWVIGLDVDLIDSTFKGTFHNINK